MILKFCVVLTALVCASLLSACGSSEDEEFKYQLTENGCDTGEKTFSDLESYCAALKNDAANNGCAKSLRRNVYQSNCASSGPFETPVT